MNAAPLLTSFLGGAIFMACLVAGLFFLRFRRRTGDRLFFIFALAFWVLAAERLMLLLVRPEHEFHPYVYLIRLAAFVLILGAIVDKNRGGPSNRA